MTVWNFILGLALLAVGSNFMYGVVVRGRSAVRFPLLGVQVPLRLIQAAISLFLIGSGLYLVFGGRLPA